MGRSLIWLTLLGLLASIPGAVAAREWKDASGSFRIEANLVTIKDGKVYLEKASGDVIPVPLDKLSKEDLSYLVGLPEYREYFAKNPLPGFETGTPLVQIKVVDESKVGEVRRFPDLGWGVRSLAFSPNAGFLAAGKMDEALVVFDVNEEARVSLHAKLEGLGQVTALAFTPDGKKLLSGGSRGRIQIWNVDANGQLTEANRFVGHSDEVDAIAISGDGQYVLSGSKEKIVRYWKLDTATEQFKIEGFAGNVAATHLVPAGEFGMACDGAVLVLIDLKKGEVGKTMQLTNSHTDRGVAIAPDTSHVVVSDTYALRMWGIRNGREFPPLQEREIQWAAVFSPDGKYVISGGAGKVCLWEVEKSRKIHEFDTQGTGYVQCLAYSPDRRHIAAIPGSAGQTLQVFRLPADVAQ